MTSHKASAATHAELHSGLPLKITGIVFLGLVLVGVVVTTFLLQTREAELTRIYELDSSRAANLVQTRLYDHGSLPLSALVGDIETLRRELGLPAIHVQVGLDDVWAGETDDSLTSYSMPITVAGGPNHDSVDRQAVVTIMRPSLELALKQYRKDLMLRLGILFVAFGLVLNLLLQRLLSRPFLKMVQTAQAFTSDSSLRFDESLNGEFGFLSRFINEALDNLTTQRRDLTEALGQVRESEALLFNERERAEVTLHSIASGVITTDQQGKIQFINPVAERLTGWISDDAHGLSLNRVLSIVNEATGKPLHDFVDDRLAHNVIKSPLHTAQLVRRDGVSIAVELSSAPIRDRNGAYIGTVLVIEDVQEARRLTNELAHQASHDELTGLYNRRLFENLLEAALHVAAGQQQQAALCYLDLDQFKVVNDTCGHQAGDQLLVELAGLFQKLVRDSDTVARLGGDEFGMLLTDCTIDDARHVAETICRSVRAFQFFWEGRLYQVGASIGVVAITGDVRSVNDALAAADVACYTAKDMGRNRVHVVGADDMHVRKQRDEMGWVSRIREALSENRLCLYSQVIMPVGDAADGYGHYEMLLRLVDKSGNLVLPAQFLPAAERFNIVTELDIWVIRKAVGWLVGLKPEWDAVAIAINLSAHSITDSQTLKVIVDLIDGSGIEPERLCFEITETAAIANMQKAVLFIGTLREMGCRFALDDFGSGMSSFAYLKQLPVDYLKIDGSYVRDVVSNPVDRGMVQAVNQIGHCMGMRTIAEYVEDMETFKVMAEIGVDYAQGAGVAPPVPLEETFFPGQPMPLPLVLPVKNTGSVAI